MSIGVGAHANLVLQDEKTVIYRYGGYNLNEVKFRNEAHLYDGTITIQRNCFPEPEFHKTVKRMPSGKKKTLIKRIPVDVDYPAMIAAGTIIIENCSNCWITTDDDKKIDVMALHILYIIFNKYQKEENMPEFISYNV